MGRVGGGRLHRVLELDGRSPCFCLERWGRALTGGGPFTGSSFSVGWISCTRLPSGRGTLREL